MCRTRKALINAAVLLSQNFASADRAMATHQMYATHLIIVKAEFFPWDLPQHSLISTRRGLESAIFGLIAQRVSNSSRCAIVLKQFEISAPFVNRACSDDRILSSPNLCRWVHALFKIFMQFRGTLYKPTKSRSKSSITQPRTDRSRSNLYSTWFEHMTTDLLKCFK